MTCGTCRYLDILESTKPSVEVQTVVDGLRAEHACRPKPTARPPHPNTMAGK